MTLRYGRAICGELEISRQREWLVTNGLGGYAMGSVAGSLERSYHGLLIEAAAPPLGRTMHLAKLDPELETEGRRVALDANVWQGDVVAPDGSPWLESFSLEDGVPTWIFLFRGRRLVRRLVMVPGQSTTAVSWTLMGDGPPVRLRLRALGSLRSHHHTAPGGCAAPDLWADDRVLTVRWNDTDRPAMRVSASSGDWERGSGFPYTNFHLRIEAERGLGHSDAHRHLGELLVTLQPDAPLYVVATVEAGEIIGGEAAFEAAADHNRELLERREQARGVADPPALRALTLAAADFVVRRDVEGKPGRTVMAGYPWFGDWGRDTMIALPGLCLHTGRPEVAAEILRTFARFVDQGMLPNRFPGPGEPPEYNTVDATLWYFRAIEQTLDALPRDEALALAQELVPVLDDIVRCHVEGTRYGIKVDTDGLLTSGAEGVQLTWMDARVGRRVVTPRMGKPVEINGLWLHALHVLTGMRAQVGRSAADLKALIERATAAFGRYWNPQTNALFDVLDGPGGGSDPSIRPNQLIALALPTFPLGQDLRRSAVRVAGRHLLTSHGLRSLTPDHPDYVGNYPGPPSHRDGIYHQGTTWGWLIGPWVRARLASGDPPSAVRADIEPLLDQLDYGVIGSVSEIFDGDAPFAPRGAPAQAWSVSELIAAWDLTH